MKSNLIFLSSNLLFVYNFRRVWECLNEIYVFGNDTSNSKRVPKTLFTFTVHGSKKICSLFRSCLEDDPSFVWPSKWPRDQFTVSLDITCKEAMKWGNKNIYLKMIIIKYLFIRLFKVSAHGIWTV